MTITPSDFSFVYSGGASNSNPGKSLGGNPSNFFIVEGINNLFDDIDSSEAELGDVEYRSFYIFNDSSTESAYIDVWVLSQIENGASIEIGITLADEVQKITFSPSSDITGGTFKFEITYSSTTETTSDISWNADFDILAQNIEDALNALALFSDITVEKQGSTGIFLATFSENDGNKSQPTLNPVDIMLTSTGDPADIAVVVNTIGSPINRIAPDIGTEKVPPTGISFSIPDTESNAINVGLLKPFEGFPIWIKRTIETKIENLEPDGFSLRIKGTTT